MKGIKYKMSYCCELFKADVESGQFVKRGGERKYSFIVDEKDDKARDFGIRKISYNNMNYCMYCGRNLDYVSV